MIALLRLTAGLILWAAAFSLIYGLHGIGCAAGWDARDVGGLSLQRAVLLAAWGVSLAAAVALALWLGRRRATTLDRAAIALGWAGVAAVAVTFLPVAVVQSCV